jgi:endoglucanase
MLNEQRRRMSLNKAAKVGLPVFLVLALAGCGEDWWPPQGLSRVLSASWQSYRQQFISPEGRVVIPERDGGAISEAQAYALLRAVWAGDEATFGRVYAWTHQNLSRPDHLLSWHWGRRQDGAWGVADANSASDGDLDYALALVLAARRGWRPPPGLPDYLAAARQVAAAIWTQEVVALPGGELLLTPGNWHEAQPPYLCNPSYFSPAAYRLFAQIGKNVPQPPPLKKGDLGGFEVFTGKSAAAPSRGEGWGGGEWERLHRDTYQLLARLNQGLGESRGAGLFPDWCRVDAAGQLGPDPGRDSHFGWEAVRLPWRLALDALWFGEPRAGQVLRERFLPFFQRQWQAKGRLAAVYNYSGAPWADYDSPVLYAGVLAAALTAGDREFAGQLAQKILSFYQEKDGRAFFVTPDNYYANNWAWLGLALYAGWVKP